MNRPPATAATPLSPADIERLVLWGSALIVCLLCCGLFVGILALPLHWLPGELPLLLLLLLLTPAFSMASKRRAQRLTGSAAATFARRAQATQLAGLALCLVVAPAYEWQRLEHGRDWLSWPFLAPVAIACALSLFASGLASHLAHVWYVLQPQPWEAAETAAAGPVGVWATLEGARSVDRTPILHALWRDWCIGGILIAGAVLFYERYAASGAWYIVFCGLLAFSLYSLVGPLLISQAARVRWTTQWRINRLTILPDVGAHWGSRAAVLTIVTLLGLGLLLALRLLDLAHVVLIWLLLNVLVPPLDLLLTWLSRSSGGNPPELRRLLQQSEQQTPPAHALDLRLSHHQTSVPFWLWLGHVWPFLLGMLAIAILVRRMLSISRAARWRAALAALLLELRALLRLLWQPSRRILASTLSRLQREVGKTRRTRRGLGAVPHDLPPRQAIIALYLAALDLAARRGRRRRASQTPYEYSTVLAADLPESQETIASMTAIFVSVRYSPLPASTTQATRMRAFWTVLRARLRRRPRSGRAE